MFIFWEQRINFLQEKKKKYVKILIIFHKKIETLISYDHRNICIWDNLIIKY